MPRLKRKFPWLMEGDCLDRMQEIPSASVDLVVTSPPYDNLREYGDKNFKWGPKIWKPCLKELHRVVKPGGVVVWIVADATIDGSETGTSFKQALYAMKCGFNLHDTMIWDKNSSVVPLSNMRYPSAFEYVFVLSKGKPGIFNPIKDRRIRCNDNSVSRMNRQKD